MVRTTINTPASIEQSTETLANEPTVTTSRRYRQAHRMADMSVGRIRRWGAPFRRPFHL